MDLSLIRGKGQNEVNKDGRKKTDQQRVLEKMKEFDSPKDALDAMKDSNPLSLVRGKKDGK